MRKADAIAKGSQHLANYLHLAGIEASEVTVKCWSHSPHLTKAHIYLVTKVATAATTQRFDYFSQDMQWASSGRVDVGYIERELRLGAELIVKAAAKRQDEIAKSEADRAKRCTDCDGDGMHADRESSDACAACKGTGRRS